MTKARKAILSFIQSLSHPVSANYIQKGILIPIDQVTVYRTLHYLEEQNMVSSFVLHCENHGTERYYTFNLDPNKHTHWFHCEECHDFINMGCCTLNNLLHEYEDTYSVKIKSHTLYITGICSKCAQK